MLLRRATSWALPVRVARKAALAGGWTRAFCSAPAEDPAVMPKNFIINIIEEDLRTNKHGGKVVTRFPPEPNGYLHLGHAKSINLNFGIAEQFRGVTNMRFDDTNPVKEDMEYVHSILDDVRWVVTGSVNGAAPWSGPVRHASDYFQTIYDSAEYLIAEGKAYIDHLSMDDIKAYRGSFTEPGRDSPFRTRSPAESLQLFRDMARGALPDGHCVLRARIDMAHPNLNMRDPVLYRIKHAAHPVAGDRWCIYPMYDFAHAISDALESITHSLCTLEFEEHRPLYDWVVEALLPSGLLPQRDNSDRPRQYEFSRLNVHHTVLSKRRLIALVAGGYVDGWDDPRLPTLSALRRRGVPHRALKRFCLQLGASKSDYFVEPSVLDDCCREELEDSARRMFAIQEPLKVTITNLESPHEALIDVHPRLPLGKRAQVFDRQLFIERADFHDSGADGSLAPPKGFKRLLLGGTVRLKNAFALHCHGVVRDAKGQATELLCTYDSASRHGAPPATMAKPKGVIHWLPLDAEPAELRLFDPLFRAAMPGKDGGDFLADINPDSRKVVRNALVDRSVCSFIDLALIGDSSADVMANTFQFERVGYFALDKDTVAGDRLVFNRVVTLRDGWKP